MRRELPQEAVRRRETLLRLVSSSMEPPPTKPQINGSWFLVAFLGLLVVLIYIALGRI